MILNNKENIQKALKTALEPENDTDNIKHETAMIMYRFLSEVERLSEEQNLTRKELAKRIGTSASYITQLFRGNKIINLETIAKFQKALNMKFTIKAYALEEEVTDTKANFKSVPNDLRNDFTLIKAGNRRMISK